ncbi:MAG TPA: serpin family protein [Polyangia bacterium]|nr:serpin family protein [Polyangia bacterium]
MALSRRLRCLPYPLLGCALAACSSPSPSGGATELRSEQVRVTAPVLQDGDPATLTADDGRFAWDLYQAVRATPGNLAFSPASLSIGLAMAYGGARGSTAAQMATTLHFSLPVARLHRAFDALDLALEATPTDGHAFQLTLANALWVGSGAAIVPDYLDLLAEDYGAGVHVVDFATAPEAARAAINQWVSGRTDGKIPELMPAGAIDPTTALALTNAVYFHADWLNAFGVVNASGSFVAPTGPVATAMMSGAEPAGGWTGAGYRAASLPYIGGASMVLIVPDAGTFDAFEAGLGADALETILATPPTTMVSVTMPRFELQHGLDLAATLQAMGMTDAFSPNAADFSGIDGGRDLFMKKVEHQAMVAVDETGTEAAAATGVTFSRKSAALPADPLVVDHPFLFAIRDDATGTILFLGRVVDPTLR